MINENYHISDFDEPIKSEKSKSVVFQNEGDTVVDDSLDTSTVSSVELKYTANDGEELNATSDVNKIGFAPKIDEEKVNVMTNDEKIVDDTKNNTEKIGERKIITSKIIFEGSKTERESDFNNSTTEQKFGEYTQYDSSSHNNANSQSTQEEADSVNYQDKSYNNEFFRFVAKMYNENPNTFKGTVIGIILSILILTMGFLKTLMIFVVVLVANIIGQIMDGNSRIISIIDSFARRFR